MSTFHQFPDGSKIEQDPRLEDPLIYYCPVKGPGIGFEVRPENEQWTAETLLLNVFNSHLGRFQALSKQETASVLEALIWSMSARYKHCKTIELDWPVWLSDVIGENTMSQWMGAAGWEAFAREKAWSVWRRKTV